MPKNLAPIRVHVWATKQAQAWRYAIDDAGTGPLLEPKERYTRKSSAVRGAVRKVLGLRIHIVRGVNRSIEFVYSKPKRK